MALAAPVANRVAAKLLGDTEPVSARPRVVVCALRKMLAGLSCIFRWGDTYPSLELQADPGRRRSKLGAAASSKKDISMRENLVRKRWAAGEPAFGAWLTIPSSFSTETMAHAGSEWVCIDMQHGVIEYAQAVLMLQGLSSTDVTPLIRVPWNEPGLSASRSMPARAG